MSAKYGNALVRFAINHNCVRTMPSTECASTISSEVTGPHANKGRVVCTVLIIAANLGVSTTNDISVSCFRLAGGTVNGIMSGLANLVARDVVIGALADPTQPSLLEWGEAVVYRSPVPLVDALTHGARVEVVVHLISTTLVLRDAVYSDDRIDGSRPSVAGQSGIPLEGS